MGQVAKWHVQTLNPPRKKVRVEAEPPRARRNPSSTEKTAGRPAEEDTRGEVVFWALLKGFVLLGGIFYSPNQLCCWGSYLLHKLYGARTHSKSCCGPVAPAVAPVASCAVSYTHLTLPTNREV